MGREISGAVFSREDRQRYRQKVRSCLDVFARMLRESRFEQGRRSVGMEIELNLTDEAGDPAMLNAQALEAIADPDFQTELGRFNLEINVPPRLLEPSAFGELEEAVRRDLNHAEEQARTVGAHMMLIGILPTVGEQHLTRDSFSDNPRYELLNEQIFAARGEDLEISIGGVERLATFADTIAPEAACTSVQLHQQVEPEAFASFWNAAQAIAGPQVAVAANSPFFFGKELWRETRIALFEQATDTRPDELKAQGVRPRVWFGERWITSIFDLFEENVRYFPALLPVTRGRGPAGDARPRRHALARGAGAAQRDGLPLEPAHLRRGARAASPAGREPAAAVGPDRRRHLRQRRLLLRAGAGAGGGGAAALVAHVVLGRGGELPRGRARRDRGARLLAGRGGGAGGRAGAAPAAARRATRGSPPPASRRPTASACWGSSSAAA